jgi:hypothetical protein
VTQISNAALVAASMPASAQRFLDDHLMIIPVGFPRTTHEHAETLSISTDPETMDAIAEGLGDIDAGLVERLVGNLNAAAEQLDKVAAMAEALTLDDVIDQADEAGMLGDDMDVENLRAYYDSFKIGPLRKIASQAGLPNAYKGGHGKNDLVGYCLAQSLLRGRRV